MGKIADALQNAREGQTPLQRKLSQLSKVLTVLVLSICAVIFAVGMFIGRLGPLTVASLWVFRPATDVAYVEESVTIG